MKYTNKYNLPKHICDWLAADDYDYNPDVISATTLIGPARAWALKRINAEELSMDYSDMLALRYGTAIHDSLEKVGVYGDGDFKERRFYAELSGFTVSGKMDALIGGVIRDNKSTSVWKIVHGEFDDYIKQLSIYRWLLAKNGIEAADYAFIDFFFTDWKKSDAARNQDYPALRYQEQRIELWGLEQTEAYISERLGEFAFALGCLPECTPEELWQTPTTYAYFAERSEKKKARNSNESELIKACKLIEDTYLSEENKKQKATKVYQESELAEAEQRVAESGGVLEKRSGKAKRCGYCTAAPFCKQFTRLKAEGLIDGD